MDFCKIDTLVLKILKIILFNKPIFPMLPAINDLTSAEWTLEQMYNCSHYSANGRPLVLYPINFFKNALNLHLLSFPSQTNIKGKISKRKSSRQNATAGDWKSSHLYLLLICLERSSDHRQDVIANVRWRSFTQQQTHVLQKYQHYLQRTIHR